ncbi:hypothetical protein, partial [Paenibacillus aceris]|uniref:hypothetical protein n=1 Tax=Paenibacillus aceris TaxID=869555 RepID=UPI001966171D
TFGRRHCDDWCEGVSVIGLYRHIAINYLKGVIKVSGMTNLTATTGSFRWKKLYRLEIAANKG